MLGDVPWVESVHPSPLSASPRVLRLPAVQPGEHPAGGAGRHAPWTGGADRLTPRLGSKGPAPAAPDAGGCAHGRPAPDRQGRARARAGDAARHGRLPAARASPRSRRVYQTVTTVATVGFREVRPVDPGRPALHDRADRGRRRAPCSTTSACSSRPSPRAISASTWKVVAWTTRIAAMRGHLIICGHGRVGRSAAEYLVSQRVRRRGRRPRPGPARRPGTRGGAPGRRTSPTTRALREAGIEHARALIVALETDADTVYRPCPRGRCAPTW